MNNNKAKIGAVNNAITKKTNNTYTIWAVSYMMEMATQAAQIFQGAYGCNFVVEEITMDAIDYRLANYSDISELPDLLLIHDSYLQKYIRKYPHLFFTLDGVLDFGVYTNAKVMNISLYGIPYGCPCVCEPVALYYNKDFADNYGININENTTWDEFIEFGRNLKENGRIYLLPPAKYLTEILMRATGRLYYDESGAVSSEGAYEVLELIEVLSSEGLLFPDDGILPEDITVKIINGEIFSVIGGPLWFSRIKKESIEYGFSYNFAVSRTPKNDVLMCESDLGGFSWLTVDKGDSDATQDIADFLVTMFNQDNEKQQLFSNVLISCDLVPCVLFLRNILDGLDNGCFVEPLVIKYLVEISGDVPEIYYGKHTEDLTEALTNIIIDISHGLSTTSQGMSDFDGICLDYNDAVLDYIVIDKAPDKTNYYKYEVFDSTGMVVHAYFLDGTDAIVNGYICTPSSLSLVDTVVTISYTAGGVTKEAIQPVNVLNREITSIEVSGRQFFLQGDTISPSDFSVKVFYDHGSFRYVSASDVFPKEASTVGDKDVIVYYAEDGRRVSTQKTITVFRKLNSIEIITDPNKMSYYKGERFNRTGMSVCATYSNGETAVVPSGRLNVNPSIVKFKDGQDHTTIIVSYTENSVKKEDILTVYKKISAELDDCEISQDMAGSGCGTVNLSSGKMSYSFEDFVGNDANIPITISHIHNPDMGNVCYVGNNWRLNLQQEIIEKNGKWLYTDKKGKQYAFDGGYEDKNERSAFRNEKLGLDLFKLDEEKLVYLIDRSNNTLVFKQINNKYRLIAMHMYPSTQTNPVDAYSLSITYRMSGQIESVTSGKKIDGIRPYIEFIYSGNGLLSELKYTQSGTTAVAKYMYDNSDNLIKIECCNANVDSNYSCVTEFLYGENSFIIKDNSSKNPAGEVKSLIYTLDDLYRVKEFKVGYGEDEQDITTLSYSANSVETGTNTNISLTTLVDNNGTVSVYSFNSFGIVSQYSYEIENNMYETPKKVNSAQSRGFSYKSLADTFSDTLDIYHDDFKTDKCGWNGNIAVNKAICGSQSIKGTSLYKTYTISSDIFSDPKTIYLSLWVLGSVSGSDITIGVNITSGTEKSAIGQRIDKNLANRWQYIALCLGQRKVGDTITVTVVSNSTIYVDDVRLTRLPYETPEDIADTIYDEFGNVKKTYQYNPIDKSIETTEYIYNAEHQVTEQLQMLGKTQKNKVVNTYSNGLLSLKKEYGASSHYTQEQFICTDNVITSSIDINNTVTKYAEEENLTSTIIVGDANKSPDCNQKILFYPNSGVVDALCSGNLQNGFTYFENGNLQKAKFNYSSSGFNAEVVFEYDTFGNLNALRIGNNALITMDYNYKHLNKTTYANGDYVSYVYDSKDRIIEMHQNGTATVFITYSDNADDMVTINHSNGVLYTSKSINNSGKTSEYCVRFSGIDRILKVVGYAANDAGNITTVGYFVDESEIPFEKCVSTKDSNGLLIKTERNYHGASSTYAYNNLYSLECKITTYTTNGIPRKYKTYYNYKSISAERKGTQIISEKHYNNSTLAATWDYTYYKNGNLAQKKLDSDVQSEYFYDEHGRLVREDNYALSRSYKLTYDNGGNITQKETYIISGGNIATTPVQTDNYDYGTVVADSGQNAAWKDQLKSYNNTSITYDALGNPLNYLGKIMTWQGKRLTSIDGMSLAYDYNGLRIKKGDRNYYWQSGNLVMERWVKNGTENYIYYYYDESGVCGMNYNGKEYYYRKNIFGDVIAIYDAFCNLQCKYVYDAWGNHKVYNANGSEIGAEVLNIGNINPIRYRGYYWDKEFGLYYLQSRYYDPALGRFISADGISYLDPESIIGFNLYAYCDNNPVMNVDPNGTWDWSRFGRGVAVVAAAALAIGITVATFGTGSVVGGIIIAGTIGAAGSVFSQTVIEGKTFAEVEWANVAINGAVGALSAIPGVNLLGAAAISGAASYMSAWLIDGAEPLDALLEGVKSAGITLIAGGITRSIGLAKISKVGKGNYAGKKVFLNHVQSAKLAQKLSSFNPSVNKSQTLLKYIVKQAGLGGLSQIASDTAGTVVNTVFDILTSIIP